MRRDLLLTTLLALVLIAVAPAYDRVLTDTSWRGAALGAGLLVLAVGLLARRLRVPGPLRLILTGLVLLAALPGLVELGAGWVAGPAEQLQLLQATLADGWTAVADEPAPTDPIPGLVLLLTLGFGVVALVAQDLIVRGGHLVAGVIQPVVLWTVPLAIPSAVAGSTAREVIPFLVAIGALLLAGVNTSQDATVAASPAAPRAIALPVSGLVLLLGAVAVGVNAPWLLPGHQGGAWLELGGGATARGYQPIVDIANRLGAPEEREVLRVRASQRTYLRLAGLDSFDGQTWRLGPADGPRFRPDPAQLFRADRTLPPEVPAARTQLVEVDVEVLELSNIYVPLPYQPIEILGPLRDDMVWSTQGGFLATWDQTETVGGSIGIREGSAYRVLAERPAPTFDDLRTVTFSPEVLAEHTRLPRGYPELGEQAEAVYAEAGASTVIEQALALQTWFVGPGGGFTYDLDVPALRGEDALTRFVLEDRVGYCEYFATAMAVMLRETGIPARVAVGFLPGERVGAADPDAGTDLDEYLVTTGDAHAWVEVLFPGYGWITFEPTPRSDDTHVLPRPDDLAPVENEAERALREAEQAAGADTDTDGGPLTDIPAPEDLDLPEGDLDEFGLEGTTTSSAAGGVGGVLPGLVVLTVALAAALLGVAWDRRRRLVTDPRGAVLAAQQHLYDRARRLGSARHEAETVREVLARWEAEGLIDGGHGAVARTVQAAAFDGHLARADAEAAVVTLDRLGDQLNTRIARRERVLVPVRRVGRRVTRNLQDLRRRWDAR